MRDPEARPNPDQLLSMLQKEENASARGLLRVFLGMAPGVGKTYAMLKAARQKKDEGVDAVIGVAVTHGRSDTDALLDGLDLLSSRVVRYKGHELEEFDLDGALERRPALIIVDELAHTNAPGSRHAKRWEDVEELLERGISVWTAMNIQHLDSLNDVVRQITDVRVAETVPDSLLETAESVVLVDLTPEDLRQRLKEGKVYVPQQAEVAMEHFFSPGNLTALREIALRAVAQRVNSEVIAYRSGNNIDAIWPTSERILVCVGPSPTSASLVRAAKRLATSLHAPWLALFINGTLSKTDHDRAFRNLELAQKLGAETFVFLGNNLPQEIIAFARRHNVTKIVVGKPVRRGWRAYVHGSPVDKIILLSGEIDIYVIRGDGAALSAESVCVDRIKPPWRDYVYTALLITACTAIGFFIQPYVAANNIIMVYLLGVITAALRLHRGAALTASLLSVLAFDFCFVEPRLSLSVNDLQNLITFFVMLATALLMSSMAWKIKRQAESAGMLEWESASLASFAQKLLAVRNQDEIFAVARECFRQTFRQHVVFLVPDQKGGLLVNAGPSDAPVMGSKELSIASWVLDTGEPAGRESQFLPDSAFRFLPVKTDSAILGVAALKAESPDAAAIMAMPDKGRLLNVFVGEIAKALARGYP